MIKRYVYCEREECLFIGVEGSRSICDRSDASLYINRQGECVFFIEKVKKCPWPCDEMYAYADRNFCPFCGRDLK